MDWNVKNAVNRDVERQHLNKILKEIRAGQDDVSGRLDLATGNLNNIQNTINNTVVKIINNTLPPSSLVTSVSLNGDVEGTSVPVPGQNAVTIQTKLTKTYIEDAPVDMSAYWRRSGQWEQVPQITYNLTQMFDQGIMVWNSDDLSWYAREIETADADRLTVTDGDGLAANPVLDLALVSDDGTGVLQRTSFDAWGRKTGTAAATTDHLPEGSINLYFTDERAQDAVGAALIDTPSVIFTYDDTANTISAESPEWVFGQEYLYAFHQKLIAGTTASMLFSGDSTTYGDGITDPRYLLHTSVLRVGRNKLHNLTATNAGHSGASTEDWLVNFVAGDIATNPDLMVLRWGFNDPFYGRTLAQFETSLRAGLAQIRASRTVAQTSIVLMTPNTSNDTPNGRDAVWLESTRAVIRKAARDYQCVFIDTYKLWEDTVNAAGNWMDNPFGDGRAIHPLEAMNGWIASKISDVIYPSAIDPIKTSIAATLSTDTTFPTGSFSTVVYDQETEDTRGEYNPATGVFTVQQTGKYLISAYAYFNNNGENRVVIVSVLVNGTEAVRLGEIPYYGTVAGTGGMAGNTTTVNLNAGDTVNISTFVFSSSGGVNYLIKNFPFATYLKINRL